jgi:DNA modification methylase
MLGESIGAVSQDLTLAGMVKAMPTLAQQESKSSARRIGTITVAVALMKKDQAAQQAAKAQAPTDSGLPPEPLYKLYEGDWRSNIASIADESVDLVYTDLPYGVNLDQMGANENVSAHGGALSYTDSRDIIIPDLAKAAAESFRVLKPSRFAVFFFGFNYYNELLTALISAGFQVNPIPVVWLKHQQFTQSPTKRYANGYEQALVAMKGSPTFVRPGQVNVVDVPGLVVTGRYQVAQQPVALVERFIKDMILTNVGSSVLDLYAGTGTTGVAALSLGCIPILFERDPEQCPIIRSRLAQVAATLASRRDQEAPTAAAKS